MADLPFTDPDRTRYFEDYTAGENYVLGSVTIDHDEMVAFAKLYDPQNIHIDAEKADAGPFNGLIASGWYTGAKAIAGRQTLSWDGRDEQDHIVAPGLYILRVSVEGDALTRTENRLISVVY